MDTKETQNGEAKSDRTPDEVQAEVRKYRHKAVKPFFIISIILTIAFYAGIVFLSVLEANEHPIADFCLDALGLPDELLEAVQRGGLLLLIILLIYIAYKMIVANILSMKDTAVQGVEVTETQFSDLHEATYEYCKLLGIKKIPSVYVTTATNPATFARISVYPLDAVRVSAFISSDKIGARFALARELARIYYKEAGVKYYLLTLAGRLLPIFSSAYSRAMEYSYDRAAQIITQSENPGEEVAKSVINYTLFRQIDFSNYQERIDRGNTPFEIMAWGYANLYSTVPIGQFRIKAMQDPEMKDGRLF